MNALFPPLRKPLARARVALVSSAGIARLDDVPFDQEGERQNPWWGDPTHRLLPREVTTGQVGIYHLHIDPRPGGKDLDCLLPLRRLDELVEEVVGVNRAIISNNFTSAGQPTNSGIGFAVSVNMVTRVAPGLIATGEYDYPYLGVSSIDSLTLDMVNALGLKSFTGAYITDVLPGGPADKAGLKAGETQTNVPGLLGGGDLVTAINGRSVRTFDELLAYLITNHGPGDTVVLTVLRGDQTVEVSITLGKRP